MASVRPGLLRRASARVGRGGVALFCAVYSTAGVALSLGPVDTSGYLGYNYRSLSHTSSTSDSQQLLGSLRLASFIGEPWLATTQLSLSIAQDASSLEGDGAATAETDTSILTGDWSLGVLPQSKTPFSLIYQITDSRVDQSGSELTPLTYLGQDYASSYLGLRQSFLMDHGGRLQMTLDDRSWESNIGSDYDSQVLGIEANLRYPEHHLLARWRDEMSEYVGASRENSSQIIDLTHNYHPLRSVRLDSKASVYDYERSFIDPLATDLRLSTTQVTQVSSNLFWRPPIAPYSVNAGVRLMSMAGDSGQVSAFEQQQIVLNGGAFYRVNQRLRLDAAVVQTLQETEGVGQNDRYMRGGALYQSELVPVFGGAGYHWHSSGRVERMDGNLRDVIGATVDLGQNLSQVWWLGERTSTTSVRMNLGQLFGLSGENGEVYDGLVQIFEDTWRHEMSVNHTASFAFNQRVWQGDSYAQLSLSDLRTDYAGETGGEEQDGDLVNQTVTLQLTRDQELGRRSSLVGDVSVQRTSINDQQGATVYPETETTTMTASVRFEHQQMFGVPRLRFNAEYIQTSTSLDEAVDRADLIGSLAYGIGMLETNLGMRLTEPDSQNYDLVYFKVMRRF